MDDHSPKQSDNIPKKGDDIVIEVLATITHIEQRGKKTDEYCPICYENIITDDLPFSTPCNHYFCLECYRSYLENKMQTFEVLNIPCPQDGCKEIIKDETIKGILGDEKYNRYQELILKKISQKNYKLKYCPKPPCFQPFTPNKDESFTVCVCGTKVCNVCSNYYHPGKPCIEVVDREFEIYAKDHEIKFCIVCKTAVNRVEGCLHMTCCVCDYEWCWTCGKQYTPKHLCKGVWDPSAPSMKVVEKTRWERFKTGLNFVLWGIIYITVIPLVFLFILLFMWPYFLFEDRNRARRRRQHASDVCCRVIVSLLIGLVTLPLTLMFVLIYVFVMALYWIYMCVTVKPLVQRIQLLRRNRRGGIKKTPRWMVQDENGFAYTQAARPQEEVAPPPDVDGTETRRRRLSIFERNAEEAEERNSIVMLSRSLPIVMQTETEAEKNSKRNNSMPDLAPKREVDIESEFLVPLPMDLRVDTENELPEPEFLPMDLKVDIENELPELKFLPMYLKVDRESDLEFPISKMPMDLSMLWEEDMLGLSHMPCFDDGNYSPVSKENLPKENISHKFKIVSKSEILGERKESHHERNEMDIDLEKGVLQLFQENADDLDKAYSV